MNANQFCDLYQNSENKESSGTATLIHLAVFQHDNQAIEAGDETMLRQLMAQAAQQRQSLYH